MGPLISDEQFEKVLGYLELRAATTAPRRSVGGDRVGDRGYFVAADGPHQHQPRDMKVVREEIFGPVVCAIPFDSPDEIVPVANDTNYGLAAGVFTRDISKAHRTAKRLRAGTVWINTYHVFDAAMPFGGYKESGWGREMGSPGPQQLPRDQVGRHGSVAGKTTNGNHAPGGGHRPTPGACGPPTGQIRADGPPGKPAPLGQPFETSVADRVASARRLAAGGTTIREIAGELGVSVSSVHNYLNAVDCPDCGRPVTNPRARRCSVCASRQPTHRYLDARGRSGRGSRVVRGTRSGAVVPGLDAVALGRESLGGAESTLAQRSGCLRSLQRAAEPLERCSRRRRRPRPFPPLERRS